MISKKDIKNMPFTFIIAPILLVSLTIVVFVTYGDMMEEKELIASLSCPELREYTEKQIIESKLYFGNEAYLSYAEDRYSHQC